MNPALQPALLYKGRIRHRRFSPRPHNFGYSLFLPCFDLQQLASVAKRTPCLSMERFGVASYRRRDHMGNPDQPLDENIRDWVEDNGGKRPSGPVQMLANLAHFGFTLNPISLFFCHCEQHQLQYIVAEVHNTPWKERCRYLLTIEGEGEAPQQFASRKQMHVSPFMAMDQQYRWRVRRQADRLTVHIENHAPDSGKIFDATLTLQAKPFTASRWLWQLCRMPAMPVKVITAIYWQAFRLWLKRIPYVPHPKHQAPSAGSSAENTP